MPAHKIDKTGQNKITQNNNRRNNRLLEFQGRTMTLAQWAREIGIEETTLWGRIVRRGLSIQEALTKPVQKQNRRSEKVVEFRAETGPVSAFADKFGISKYVVYKRLLAGMSLEEALLTPVRPKQSSQKRQITFNKKTQGISEWARELGFKPIILYNRLIQNGWSIERAFTEPVRKRK